MTGGLLRDTAELLARCPCGDGCPSCVGPVGEIGERGKYAAMRILSALCQEQAGTTVLPLQSKDASV